MTQALNARTREARGLKPLENMLREGSHVPVGTAACDNHIVGDRGLAPEVDRNDVFGFVFVEGLEDELDETLAAFAAAPLTYQRSFSLSDASRCQRTTLASAAQSG